MHKILLMMLLVFTTSFSSVVRADDSKVETDVKEVSKKVTKRKGYCSPLDKMTGNKNCKSGKSSDEKIVDKAKKKLKKIDKKVQKREDYCSPLDKIANKKGCVGK